MRYKGILDACSTDCDAGSFLVFHAAPTHTPRPCNVEMSLEFQVTLHPAQQVKTYEEVVKTRYILRQKPKGAEDGEPCCPVEHGSSSLTHM